MSKNPFQILDFLGYFFPGATVMIALCYYVPSLGKWISASTDTSAIIYIVCIVLAYIIGHVVSLLSSITVEKYAVWKFGYPFDYLLNDFARWNYFSRQKAYETELITKKRRSLLQISKCIVKAIIGIVLFPISILDLLLSLLFGIDYYYTRKLSGQQINMIQGKSKRLFHELGINVNDDMVMKDDNHRIVHNYYYENDGKHSGRMENCIAIYDFLRAMTLVFCMIFMVELVRAIKTIDFGADVDGFRLKLLAILAILSYIMYMGFLKFYRKFTIENFMCLLCDKNMNFLKHKGEEEYTTGGDIYQSTEVNTVTIN